jgi:hypothetical protein
MGYPEVPRGTQGCSNVGPGHSQPETRRPKETRSPKSELIATPAEQPPIESGHARNSELPPITQMGADNKAVGPAGRRRHWLFPICEYRRHLRLRNSDFGLLSAFGFQGGPDFRAALPDPCRSYGAWLGIRGGRGYKHGAPSGATLGGRRRALTQHHPETRDRARFGLRASGFGFDPYGLTAR